MEGTPASTALLPRSPAAFPLAGFPLPSPFTADGEGAAVARGFWHLAPGVELEFVNAVRHLLGGDGLLVNPPQLALARTYPDEPPTVLQHLELVAVLDRPRAVGDGRYPVPQVSLFADHVHILHRGGRPKPGAPAADQQH